MLAGTPRSAHAVEDSFVKIDQWLLAFGGLGGGEVPHELLLFGHRGVTGILDQPVDESDAGFDLRHEAE